MERDSFIFYRSFYEAIRELPKEIRLEVLTAIVEYGLFGREPEGLKPFARGMFTLVKPNLDANISRFKNGTRGGRPSKNSNNIPVTESSACAPSTTPDYSSFEEEIKQIKEDQIWFEAVCMRSEIEKEELNNRLDAFLLHCKIERDNKLHPSLTDAKRHFSNWMKKAYSAKTNENNDQTIPTDYTYNGGFGGVDK